MDIIQEIKRNKSTRTDSYYNCIPFIGFNRLERYIPGIEKSTYYLVTANSGIGKSKFVRSMFVHHPIDYVKNHPQANINLKIFYFSLEESRKKILLSEISKMLWTDYGIRKSVKELMSVGRYNSVTKDVIDKIEDYQSRLDDFESMVSLYDDIRRPDKIYQTVLAWLKQNGHSEYKTVNMTDKDGNIVEARILDKYTPYIPNTYVIVIVDHIKLLQGLSASHSIKQTMDLWSSKYCLELRDKYGVTLVNVQQQASSQESLDNFKLSKLEPSLNGLGEHKLTQQDANVVLGLFAPDRHELSEHRGFDISILGDNYRSLSVLKDRDGASNLHVPLYFDGAVDYFKEYPRPEHMKVIYSQIANGTPISKLYEDFKNNEGG